MPFRASISRIRPSCATASHFTTFASPSPPDRGFTARVFDYLDEKCEALVIESFGTGGLPAYGGWEERLQFFLQMGKTVVFTTQVEREGSALDKYEVGNRLKELGRVLEARSMTLESAVCKLMWILPFAGDEDIEGLFYEPIMHDIL